MVADNVWTVLRPMLKDSMIELRDGFENRHQRHRAAHHSPSPDARPSRAASSSPIVGPSGSGKSTLLGLIAGLDAPTSGAVLIDGVDITRLGEDALAKLRGEKIGFVFQFFHLIPSLTAYENVAVPMEIAGVANPAARARALLEEVGSDRTRAPLPVAALRRRAAARRAGPRARQRSADRAGRRADRQSRHDQRPPHHGPAPERSTGRAARRSCS